MRGKRQNIQYSLALDLTGRGESPLGGHQGTEPPVAKPDPESPALAEPLLRLNPDEPPWYGPSMTGIGIEKRKVSWIVHADVRERYVRHDLAGLS